MNARGVSLIELLVACALVALIGGGVAALAGPIRHALARSDGNAQLEPAARAGLEALLGDLREAGADSAIADRPWRISALVPSASPLRDLDSSDPVAQGNAVRVRRTPFGAAQGVLSADVVAGSTVVPLDTTARCAGGPPVCSFRPADAGVLYNGAAAETVTINAVGGGTVVLARPLAYAYAAGAVLAALETTSYGTREGADGSRQLVRISTGGAEQPVLDNVVDFDVTSDSADPSQISCISIRLRLEAPSAALRGPAGYLFRRAGSAVNARQWLPDVQLFFTVALRNPTGG